MAGTERKRQKNGRCEVSLKDIVARYKEQYKPLARVFEVIFIV